MAIAQVFPNYVSHVLDRAYFLGRIDHKGKIKSFLLQVLLGHTDLMEHLEKALVYMCNPARVGQYRATEIP
jgi:hypothetical protein